MNTGTRLENKTESTFQEFQQIDEVDEAVEVDELNSCQKAVNQKWETVPKAKLNI